MSDKDNQDNPEINNDDATIKANASDLNNDDKTVAFTPAQEDNDDKTILNDSDETKMGDLPNMGMLAIGARLEIISKDGHGEEFYITSEETTVGRSESSDIVMDFPGVSRNHFSITTDGNSFYIEDANSKYGTYIGKNKTSGKKQIKPGDIIQAGELTLKFKTADSDGSSINKPLIFGAAGVVVLLLLVLFIASGKKEKAQPVQTEAKTKTAAPAEISANLFKAKNAAASGDLEGALTTLSKILEVDADNAEAVKLRDEWQKKLLLSTKLERASKLLEAGSIEQARVLAMEILDSHQNNKMASELLQRIKKLSDSKESLEILKKAHDLVNKANYDHALRLLKKVDSKELTDEVNKLKEQIDEKKKTIADLKKAKDSFLQGNIEETKKLTQGILAINYNKEADELSKKIGLISSNLADAERLLLSSSPFTAKKHLYKIIELAGPANPLSDQAKEKLSKLKADSLIFAHEKYQKSLAMMADGNLKDAYKNLKILVADMPEISYFRNTLDEVRVHLDNLARSIFRAGYVLEQSDPIKAKELWQHLQSLLPEDHSYYKKIKKKI